MQPGHSHCWPERLGCASVRYGNGPAGLALNRPLDGLVTQWLPIGMDVFAAIADPVRRGLLEQLARSGEMRVVDLTRDRGISRPAVSRHLRVLGEAGLVRATDRGRERHYELVAGPLHEVVTWAGTLVAAQVASSGSRPPVAAHQLDALDLEVRRTVRERSADTERTDAPGEPHTEAPPTRTGESA